MDSYFRCVPVGHCGLDSYPTLYFFAFAVGFLRQDPAIYDCPVYTTTFRGHTYTFLATLRTAENVHKWTLAGVALIMQEDD